MIKVTTEDMQQADTEAEKAREALGEAERAYAANRVSVGGYEAHQEAFQRHDHAATKARLLREEWERQQAARDLRAAEGEVAARELSAEAKKLSTSQGKALKAAVAASEAMAAVLVAFSAHSGLVKAVGGELATRGLRSVDGEATGQLLDGSARVDGVSWPLIDGGSVLAALLNEVVGEHLPRHPMTRVPMPSYDGYAGVLVRNEVLAAVKAARGR